MSDMTILLEMIKQKAIEAICTEYGKPYITLREPQEADSSATIRGIPEDTLIIKIDAIYSPDKIFNGKRGECTCADYVLISSQKKCIVYVEMKKTKGSRAHIEQQLLGAQCFIEFCTTIGRKFWCNENFLTNYKSRFVSIGHTSIAKKKTRITRETAIHDSPASALKIDWPNYLQFNHLAGLGA